MSITSRSKHPSRAGRIALGLLRSVSRVPYSLFRISLSSQIPETGAHVFPLYLKMKVLKRDPVTMATVWTKRTSPTPDTNGATPLVYKSTPDALTDETTEADDPDIQHCV
jgi:hypothetical protein